MKLVEWEWEAHYRDGTVLKQEGHKVSDIRQDELASFRLVSQERSINIQWRPQLKLNSFFYRVTMIPNQNITTRIYCIDYQEGESRWVLAVMPDGSICLVDDIDSIRME